MYSLSLAAAKGRWHWPGSACLRACALVGKGDGGIPYGEYSWVCKRIIRCFLSAFTVSHSCEPEHTCSFWFLQVGLMTLAYHNTKTSFTSPEWTGECCST